jgi:hypothetical protein
MGYFSGRKITISWNLPINSNIPSYSARADETLAHPTTPSFYDVMPFCIYKNNAATKRRLHMSAAAN